MSELHAAIGLAQLERFSGRLAGRQAFAARYIREIQRFEAAAIVGDAGASPWQVFPILLPDSAARDRLIALAAAEGLEIRCYYHPSLSRWPALGHAGSCAISESLAERMAVLPVRAQARGPEADAIIEIIRRCLAAALSAK